MAAAFNHVHPGKIHYSLSAFRTAAKRRKPSGFSILHGTEWSSLCCRLGRFAPRGGQRKRAG